MAIMTFREISRIHNLRPENILTTIDRIWSIEKDGWINIEPAYIVMVLEQLKRIYESWFGSDEIGSRRLVFVNRKADVFIPTSFAEEGIISLNMASRTFNDGCELIYQASHEIMHVVLGRRKTYRMPPEYMWFEETVCDLASLAALRHPLWNAFSVPCNVYNNTMYVQQYADDNYATVPKVKPDFTVGVFRLLKDRLEKDPYMREVNALFAVEMANRVQIDADFWACIRSFTEIEGQALPIEQAFRLWHKNSSGRKKAIVAKVIDIFEPQSSLPQQGRAY